MTIVLVAVESSQGNGFRETVLAQVFIHVAQELVVTLADETETTTETGKTIELRECTRDDKVVVLIHQRSDLVGITGDEAGIGLVDEYHCVGGDMLHDIANLLRSQSVTCGIVRRC